MSNEFEKDVQSKRNDIIDGGLAFVATFGFIFTIFIIAQAIEFIGTM